MAAATAAAAAAAAPAEAAPLADVPEAAQDTLEPAPASTPSAVSDVATPPEPAASVPLAEAAGAAQEAGIEAPVEDATEDLPEADHTAAAEVAAAVEPEADHQTQAEVAADVEPEDNSAAHAEPRTDALEQAIQDGSCRLLTDFDPPKKGAPEEAPTPPTALPGSPAPPGSPAEPEPEAWADFVERAGSLVSEAGIADDPAALFEVFQTTDDLGLTFASFARLYALAAKRAADAGDAAAQPPWAAPGEAPGRSWRFPFQPIQRLLGSHWRAQKLWRLLAERTSRPEYAEAPCSKGRLEGKRCLVVGAGPCGLRAAIELRLLGAQVVVVEQRVRFTRINQLHIWSWCGEDLKGLGARIIEPPPKDFGSNPDLLVIAINDLQKLLLKVALLLGADVRLGLSYGGVRRESGSWTADLGVASNAMGTEGRAGAETPATALMSFAAPGGLPPSPFAPGPLGSLAAVLGSGGFASAVGDEVGMRMVESDGLRKETAIGLICNVARTHGRAEADLRSYSMARQFYTAVFKRAAKETGADLENIVYVKAPTAHYFVMTPTPKSLIATGVVVDERKKPMLARENISQEKLDELVRRVISFPFKQGEPTLMAALNKDLDANAGGFPGYADAGPRLFDFSKMRRSAEGLLFLQPQDASPEEGEGEGLLVTLAGDALIEPFWPEGLGIVRGFFSVLDACHAVHQWSNGATCAATQEVYQGAFQKLKTLSAATRANVLRENEKKFALAPNSRYR